MFQQLELKYFRQHESLTLDFQQGVIAIRGANEAGKSSAIESIAYALFGATALRESIEDTVTWGKKPGDLKVRVNFHLNGVDYLITRSKSGAEIKADERILAAGQKEVTKYVETLLGASADVCSRLMLANQADIKGALSKGPSAAVELIEKLSNLSVIDQVIGLVQTQLPSGATAAVDSRIAMLDQQIAVPVEDETGPLAATLKELQEQLDEKLADASHAKDAYDSIQEAAQAAQAAEAAYEKAQAEADRLEADHKRVVAALAAHKVPACPGDDEIVVLRKKVEDASYMARAEKAAEVLGKISDDEVSRWEGTHEALMADRASALQRAQSAQQALNEAKTAIATFNAQKITQTACGLCGKDLSKVPEVTTKNAELDERIRAEQLKQVAAQGELTAANDYVKDCDAILAMDRQYQQAFQRAGEFVKVLPGHVPPYFEWAGPAELTEGDGNAAAQLAQAEAAVKAHHAAVGREQQLVQDADKAAVAWAAAVKVLDAALRAMEGHAGVLDNAANLLHDLQAAQDQAQKAQAAAQAGRHALEVAQAGLRERQAARKALEAQLAQARVELAEIQDNNALIKYLRECRPLITDQLWNMVMAAVSQYFSDIRGVPSVVQRSDNGFQVDGHSVAGLSGSTQDALGLAIRTALTKTFLPNASFMVLDEPAAACDDERETNMLGLVSTAGFEQVLLVTHSSLADSFASQVVQL